MRVVASIGFLPPALASSERVRLLPTLLAINLGDRQETLRNLDFPRIADQLEAVSGVLKSRSGLAALRDPRFPDLGRGGKGEAKVKLLYFLLREIEAGGRAIPPETHDMIAEEILAKVPPHLIQWTTPPASDDDSDNFVAIRETSTLPSPPVTETNVTQILRRWFDLLRGSRGR